MVDMTLVRKDVVSQLLIKNDHSTIVVPDEINRHLDNEDGRVMCNICGVLNRDGLGGKTVLKRFKTFL